MSSCNCNAIIRQMLNCHKSVRFAIYCSANGTERIFRIVKVFKNKFFEEHLKQKLQILFSPLLSHCNQNQKYFWTNINLMFKQNLEMVTVIHSFNLFWVFNNSNICHCEDIVYSFRTQEYQETY